MPPKIKKICKVCDRRHIPGLCFVTRMIEAKKKANQAKSKENESSESHPESQSAESIPSQSIIRQSPRSAVASDIAVPHSSSTNQTPTPRRTSRSRESQNPSPALEVIETPTSRRTTQSRDQTPRRSSRTKEIQDPICAIELTETPTTSQTRDRTPRRSLRTREAQNPRPAMVSTETPMSSPARDPVTSPLTGGRHSATNLSSLLPPEIQDTLTIRTTPLSPVIKTKKQSKPTKPSSKKINKYGGKQILYCNLCYKFGHTIKRCPARKKKIAAVPNALKRNTSKFHEYDDKAHHIIACRDRNARHASGEGPAELICICPRKKTPKQLLDKFVNLFKRTNENESNSKSESSDDSSATDDEIFCLICLQTGHTKTDCPNIGPNLYTEHVSSTAFSPFIPAEDVYDDFSRFRFNTPSPAGSTVSMQSLDSSPQQIRRSPRLAAGVQSPEPEFIAPTAPPLSSLNKPCKKNIITDATSSEDEVITSPKKKPRRSSRIESSSDQENVSNQHASQNCGICDRPGHKSTTCPLRGRFKTGTSKDTQNDSTDKQNQQEDPCTLCGNPNHTFLYHLSDYINTIQPATEEDAQERFAASQVSENRSSHSGEGNGQQEEGECDCCHRFIDIMSNPLKLKILNRRRLALKKFGDTANLNNDSRVCDECHKYLHLTSRNRDKWEDCWPAALFSMFSEADFIDMNKIEEFMYFVPRLYRIMWHPDVVAAHFLQPIQQFWRTPAQTVDLTHEFKYREWLGRDEALGDETVLLMDKWCVPSTRCPLGCGIYIDIEEEVEYLPAYHYLAKFCKQLSWLGADTRKIEGFRPDWPARAMKYGFEIIPGVIIRDGIQIVMCSKMIHSGPEYQYCHPPVNPVLEYESLNIPDRLAPISNGPRLIRPGNVGEFTTSHPVLEMRGNSAGASTYNLYINPQFLPNDFTESYDKSMLIEALALANRKEIYQYATQSRRFGTKYVKDRIALLSDRSLMPPTQQRIKECIRGGTYVMTGDAIFLQRCLNADKINEALSAETLKCMKLFTHINDDYGHAPLMIPYEVNDQRNPTQSKIIKLVFFMLIHVRSVHYAYLQQNWRQDGLDQLKKDFYKLFGNFVQQKNERQFKNKCLAIETRLEEHVRQDIETAQSFNIDDFTPSNCVALILHYLTGIKVISQKDDQFYEAAMAEDNDHFILVQPEEGHVIEETISGDRFPTDYHMISAASLTEGENMCEMQMFQRWTADHKYYKIENENVSRAQDGEIINYNFNIMIYSSPKAANAVPPQNIIPQLVTTSNILCHEHKEWLIAERTSNLNCGQEHCRNKANYRCADRFGRGQQCTVGVCRRHYRIISQQVKDGLHEGMIRTARDPNINVRLPRMEEHDDALNIDIPRDIIEPLPNERHDGGWAEPYFMQQSHQVEYPEMSNPVRRSYASNVACGGQYMNANYLNTANRFNYTKRAPIALQQVLNNCRSKLEGNSIPMIYPKAVMDTHMHFASAPDGAPIGGVPLSSFGTYGRSAVRGGLASLQDHLHVQHRDPMLIASSDDAITSVAFDATVDQLTEKVGPKILFRQGLEHVHRSHVDVDAVQKPMGFDVGDANKHINNLSHFIREYPWDIFLTITPNDAHTPGLRVIRQRMIEYNSNLKRTEYEFEKLVPLYSRVDDEVLVSCSKVMV